MKVFNLTDVSTRQLRQQGLVGCPVRDKFGQIIPPGACVECRDTPENRNYLSQHFGVRGVLALDRPPEGYTPRAAEPKKEPEVVEEVVLEAPDMEKTETKKGKKRGSRRGTPDV